MINVYNFISKNWILISKVVKEQFYHFRLSKEFQIIRANIDFALVFLDSKNKYIDHEKKLYLYQSFDTQKK